MENWRFIEENPDYMISDHGRVLSFKGRSKLILCAKIMGTGYETVILPNKGVCIEYKIHRLVAKAFIPNPEQLPQINHLDGNTMNNHVSNLEWCDAYTNMMHAIRTGLRRTGVGSHQTPFAVTDATGKVLRAYPSMKEMVREERLKPAHRNWLILQLKHPDRVKQHALRVQHHRGDAFIMVQTRPNQTTVLNRTTIPNRPTMPNQTTTPPMDAHFSPVLHSVTKQYYRQLSKEEAIAFGVISRAVCKQERRILP